MTATTPVERVAQALENAKFRRMPQPLQVAGLSFEALAAFIGNPPAPDLVVVGDTSLQSVRDLQRTVEGVGRALDVVRSRRPLTLVLVGPRPESQAITTLSRYARVLTIGELADEASIANWLAVLLPLHLPQPAEARGLDSLETLRTSAEPLAAKLIDEAPKGTEAVAKLLVAMIEEPFFETEEDDEETAS